MHSQTGVYSVFLSQETIVKRQLKKKYQKCLLYLLGNSHLTLRQVVTQILSPFSSANKSNAQCADRGSTMRGEIGGKEPAFFFKKKSRVVEVFGVLQKQIMEKKTLPVSDLE